MRLKKNTPLKELRACCYVHAVWSRAMKWFVYAVSLDKPFSRSISFDSEEEAQSLLNEIRQRQPLAKWYLGIGKTEEI